MALTEGLVSYWKLDESSGNAVDSVGSFTLTNTNTVTYSTAKINNGAVFAKTSKQTLRRATNDVFPTASACSVSAWVKFNSFGATGYPSNIVTGGNVASPYVLYALEYAEFPAGTKYLSWTRNPYGGTVSFDMTPTWTPSTGVWYHIVATHSNSVARLYVNGSKLGTDTTVNNLNSGSTGATTSTDDFIIGRQWYTGDDNNDRYLDGTVDEVGIWSRALSVTEITQLYAGGNGLTYPFLPANLKFRPGSLGSLL